MITFAILSWLGIFLYLILMAAAGRLLKNNESALLHLFICFVFVLWLPVPIFFYVLNPDPLNLLSLVFGCLFLLMIIMTMAFQTAHLAYSGRQSDRTTWDVRDDWMILGMLGDGFESIAGVVFHLWTILLAASFFENNHYIMGIIFILPSLLIVRNLFILLDVVMRRPPAIFKTFKMNPIVTNLETFIVFLILICWECFK